MQTYYRTTLEVSPAGHTVAIDPVRAKACPASELHETPLVDTYVDYFDTLEAAAAWEVKIEAIEAGN